MKWSGGLDQNSKQNWRCSSFSFEPPENPCGPVATLLIGHVCELSLFHFWAPTLRKTSKCCAVCFRCDPDSSCYSDDELWACSLGLTIQVRKWKDREKFHHLQVVLFELSRLHFQDLSQHHTFFKIWTPFSFPWTFNFFRFWGPSFVKERYSNFLQGVD